MLETKDFNLALHTCEWYREQGRLCHVTFPVGGYSAKNTKYQVIDSRTQEVLKLLED